MIDDPDLLRFLQAEEANATDTTLNDERKTALEMYRGDLFGDEVEGRSKLRTRDVAEVVDYMTVSILRTLVSSDKIVEFEPGTSLPPAEMMANVPPEQMGQVLTQWTKHQDDLAQQATERVHANFMLEQDGYAILHDGIKAGLLEKSGVWKSRVERKFRFVPTRLNAAQLEAHPDAISTGQVDDEEIYDIDDETGEKLAVYDAMIKEPLPPKFCDEAVPNEQFFFSPDTRTLPTSPYCGDWSRQSLSDLLEMGYSEEDIETLWGNQSGGQNLSDARDEGRSQKESSVSRNDLNRIVTLREEYCRWWHGPQYTLVKVHRVGSTILSVEPADENPYTLWCPFPMQHRLIGHSLADKTMDIQVVRSHMLRQAMDALYIANAPRLYVDMTQCDDVTIDDTLDVAPGGLIRGRGPNAVTAIVQPFAANYAFEAMEIMAGEKESRTGITRLNQGLDADALNKTATGTALMQASGQQIEEYIARNAVNAIGEMFEKKLRLMRTDMQPHQFRIDGQPQVIKPQEWPQDMRLGVRVGLGTGSKEKRIQSLTILAQAQGDVREIDPRMIGPEEAFNTFKKLTGELGMGLATQYCKDPATLPPAPDKPDPATMEAQAKAQQAAQQQQFDQQATAAKIHGEQQLSAVKLQTQRESDAASLQAMREKALAEQQLARQRAEFEANLAVETSNREYALKVEQMNRDHQFKVQQASQEAELSKMRNGGRLDA